MNPYFLLLLILVVQFLLYLACQVIAAYFIYTRNLKRRTKEQWNGESLVDPTPEHIEMDRIGQEWLQENREYCTELAICRNGLRLFGEYFDFGYDRAVIILSGRTESRRYGYYFAAPYQASGCNIMVLDPRAHGKSDGIYNTVGFEESLDALSWAALLHEKYGVESICFHGICIGAAGGILALVNPSCPDYIRGIVTEGMFPRFSESMKNHLIERKKLFYPVLECIDLWMRIFTGHTMTKGPIDVIGTMNTPILMLQSLEDKYSLPEAAKTMFTLCPARDKKLVFFEHGAHSMLRITDTETYDSEIEAFMSRIAEKEPHKIHHI